MTDTHTSVIKEKVDVNGRVDEAAEEESKNEEVSDKIQEINGEVRSYILNLKNIYARLISC